MECGKIMLQLVFVGMCGSVCLNSFLKHWHSYIPSDQAIHLSCIYPTHPARNSTQPIYIPIRYTSAYIIYTWHTHTHTHTTKQIVTQFIQLHTGIYTNKTLGIYTYTHDKYTTSCRYTYTCNIYTYALSIDNYTPRNYKYRLDTYNMIIYTTA